MDPSGYCHRKGAGLPPSAAAFLFPTLRPFSIASRLPQFGVALGVGILMPCTWASLNAIASAFLASSVRPSYGLPTAFRHFGVRNRFRTLKTAQGRASLAPDQGALSALLETPLPPYRLPLPNQFFPRSSPRPISIIKLHTLPHFHR